MEQANKDFGLSYSPEETAHDFNLEFLKHLDTLKAEEVKNKETEITSEVLSDAEKLSRVQQAFGLRKQIKSDTSKSVSSKWWKSEEVKNNEIQTASKVLSDSEKLVQVQSAFTLRMKIHD